MSAQESLDSSNHRTAMTMLLQIPEPLVTRQVGPRQPETQEDEMQAEQLQGLDLGARVSKLRTESAIFTLQILKWRRE